MNTDQIQIINDLKSGVDLLINRLEKEKKERADLKITNQELQKKVNMLETKISELEIRYSNLKLAKALIFENGDVHDAKIKVNRILREIDKCIALLNR